MRILKLAIPFLCVLSLSACAGGLQGMKAEYKNTPILKSVTPRITAQVDYLRSSGAGVLKPPMPPMPIMAVRTKVKQAPFEKTWSYVPPVVSPETGHAWYPVKNYDVKSGASNKAPVKTDYNDSVQVFPLDDESSFYDVPPTPRYNTNVNSGLAPITSYPISGGGKVSNWSPAPASRSFAAAPVEHGTLVKKIYFGHGSSKVKKKDKVDLNKIANGIRESGLPVTVMIVGHASKRVNGVKDPIKKQIINLKMAQKRANSVTSELKRAGVKPDWVQSYSMGSSEAKGWKQEGQDRRAEVFVNRR